MTTRVRADMSRDDVDALVTDRYLDSLLAAADRHADDAPSDADLDTGVRDAARVLGRSLVRFHPSFRFEERLASRLAALASAQAGVVAAAGGSTAHGAIAGRLLGFPPAAASAFTSAASGPTDADPLLDAILRGDLDPTDADAVERAARLPGSRRPLIGGVAITSAAISIVGVAWVAWRAAHPAAHPADGTITRIARSDHVRRVAAAMSAGGLGGPA